MSTLNFKPLGISFQAFTSPDGTGFLNGAIYGSNGCKCKVVGNGTLTSPLQIKRCDDCIRAINEHAAFNGVKEAAENGYDHLVNITNLLRSGFTKSEVAVAIDRTKGELARFHKALSALQALRGQKDGK